MLTGHTQFSPLEARAESLDVFDGTGERFLG
jgi:hypothetical protein